MLSSVLVVAGFDVAVVVPSSRTINVVVGRGSSVVLLLVLEEREAVLEIGRAHV